MREEFTSAELLSGSLNNGGLLCTHTSLSLSLFIISIHLSQFEFLDCKCILSHVDIHTHTKQTGLVDDPSTANIFQAAKAGYDCAFYFFI